MFRREASTVAQIIALQFSSVNKSMSPINVVHFPVIISPWTTTSPGSWKSRSLLRRIPPLKMATSSESRGDEIKEFAEIVVIRHGETLWNAEKRLQGHMDVELNDEGRKQAVAVAEKLARDPKVHAVYSSDLKRAFETAEIIAKSCGVLQVIKDPDLRERHLGDLQGLVLVDAAETHPKAYKSLLTNRTDKEIPGGGESLDQLYDRCTSALQRIAEKHIGERVVVVTHGGVIRSLHRHASPHGRSGKIANTSVNVFRLSKEEEWTIKTWGDVSHLNQTGFLMSGFGGDNASG